MRLFALLPLAALLACSDDSETIGPDPTGTSSSTTDAASSSSAGAGGSDGGGGSGGGNMQALGYENGTRLRARNYVGSDGSKQFAGWHDTTLDADCTPLPSSDGSVRCLPSTQILYTDASTGYYSNAVCTNQVAVGPCGGAKYAIRSVYGCPVRYDISGVDQPFTGQVYQKVGASCIEVDLPQNQAAYVMTGQYMPETFVEMTAQVD